MKIIAGIFLLIVIIVLLVVLLARNDGDHPKYPPTDTLGGWD